MHLPPTGFQAFHNQDLSQGSRAVVLGPVTVQLSQGHSADQRDGEIRSVSPSDITKLARSRCPIDAG